MTTPLITRLEEAAEGSRDLDARVASVFSHDVESDDGDFWWGPFDEQAERVPDFTTSLDAALALAERVLPGWEWLLRTDEERGFMVNCWRKGDEPNMGDECFPSYAATPVLALCAAILRANHKDKP